MLHRPETAARDDHDGRHPGSGCCASRRVPDARGFSLRRRTGRWRDALRRRYLAAADVVAVFVAGAASGISPAVMTGDAAASGSCSPSCTGSMTATTA